MSQQGQGDMVGPRSFTAIIDDLQAVADQYRSGMQPFTAPTMAALFDRCVRELQPHLAEYDRLHTLLSSSRWEQGWRDGIEAVGKLIDRKVSDYTSEHGSLDPETGAMEFSRSGEEYVSTLEELAEEIRAINAAPQPTAGGDAPDPEQDFAGWMRDAVLQDVTPDAALSAERARVIEECAKVAETFHEDDDGIDRQVKRHVAAALRALGQQDTGGTKDAG